MFWAKLSNTTFHRKNNTESKMFVLCVQICRSHSAYSFGFVKLKHVFWHTYICTNTPILHKWSFYFYLFLFICFCWTWISWKKAFKVLSRFMHIADTQQTSFFQPTSRSVILSHCVWKKELWSEREWDCPKAGIYIRNLVLRNKKSV